MIKEESYRQEKNVRAYYKLHSPIYDATRWCFLFGRDKLLDELPELPANPRILEVGCGTGKNLTALEYLYPDAAITGIDLSEKMLKKASKKISDVSRIKLFHHSYGAEKSNFEPFDLILLSYSLAMMGGNIESILKQTTGDLSDNGCIAVVDFNTTAFGWFRRWMNTNHVQIDGSLLLFLKEFYRPVETSIHSAYFGLWSYFLFVGRLG